MNLPLQIPHLQDVDGIVLELDLVGDWSVSQEIRTIFNRMYYGCQMSR